MLEVLKKNTVEPLLVGFRDRLENITDLSTVSNLRFDVLDSADVVKMLNVIPGTDGMTAICVIDTTTGGGWATDEYRLYIKFTDGTTNPILFATKFRVEDD